MEFEAIQTQIPGPRSRSLGEALRTYESRGVTYLADDFPIFWESAEGALVTDVDGNRFIDLTAAFGVASVGHTNAAVIAALGKQAGLLLHGLGDVHPSRVRVQLLTELARLAPGRLEKSFLCSSGSEAVDFALKTAYLRTKKAGILAFEGSYHGLSSSALAVTGIERFRAPFAPFAGSNARFTPFPPAAAGPGASIESLRAVEELLRPGSIGACIVEPIQGRGGIVIPPNGWLQRLRELCDRYGVVLIFDEIYTGFGRTGTMFACERDQVTPDLLCLGKAIADGLPLAAVVGTRTVMDAWASSQGESLHTSTYLGNPLACAAALATFREIEERGLVARAATLGTRLGGRLERLRRYPWVHDVRGRGMLWGVELSSATLAFGATKEALRSGIIVLPSGVGGNVIAISPPIVIEERQLVHAVDVLEESLVRTSTKGRHQA